MFHQAYDVVVLGNGATEKAVNNEATALLYDAYPTRVQDWITDQGGLHDDPLILYAETAWSLGVERCR